MYTKIAIQGEKNSFHDLAAKKLYSDQIKILPCLSFNDVFKAIESGRVEVGLCAIENSLTGSINQTYDLLLHYNFSIIAEIYLPISQNLIALPESQLTDIRKVYSHPVALAQCTDFLDRELPKAVRIEYFDTAASIRLVKNLGDKQVAAIGPYQAAKQYKLKVLSKQIETNHQNYTRFVAISKKQIISNNPSKTSLIISTSHQPGALYRALGVFVKRNINLLKLQSQPIIGQAWHYHFYIDVDMGLKNIKLVQSLDELVALGNQVRILGSYIAGDK